MAQTPIATKVKSPRTNPKEEVKTVKPKANLMKIQVVKTETVPKPKHAFNADVELMKRLKSKPIVPKTTKASAKDEMVVAFLKKTLEEDESNKEK